jgi:hypothetical protein
MSDGVGDVNGVVLGSGARYNSGKIRADLLPISVIDQAFEYMQTKVKGYTVPVFLSTTSRAEYIRRSLGRWQKTGRPYYLVSALVVSVYRECEVEEPWTLSSFRPCANVLAYGAKKYAAWNWARGSNWSVPFACALRHLDAILLGEMDDQESKCSHLAHVTCNILFLLQYQYYPELNDMPFAVLKDGCHI